MNNKIALEEHFSIDGMTYKNDVMDAPIFAAAWFDNCPISEPDRVKIGRENAAKLFNLNTKALTAPQEGARYVDAA